MTCIVALKKGNTVYMGGDSAGVAGDTLYHRVDEKVFINGPMIMGFTDSFRMGQILRYHLKVPDQKCKDDLEFLCTEFIDAVQETLDDNGFGNTKEGRKNGGTFLIGYKNEIYIIHNDYQVSKNVEDYAAVGCGEDYAKGCLFGLSFYADMDPLYKVNCALNAASWHNCWVASPYVIKKISYYGVQTVGE